MEENVGLMDQKVRIGLGAVSGLVSLLVLAQSQDLVSEFVALPEIASPILGVIALALLATGYKRECGVYSAVGMDTTE